MKSISSPHVHSELRTGRIMPDVMMALLPALAVGIYRFGIRAAEVVLTSIACAVAAEWLYCVATRHRSTVTDGSAAVTGLLLAMTLPVRIPLWQVAVGAAFAIVVIKELGGGLGENVFNPALSARALLMLAFPASMTHFSDIDGITSATPLHRMVMSAMPEESVAELFFGHCGGCIGEVSAFALLLGGAYLVGRKVISIRIPAAFLSTAAILTFLFPKSGTATEWMLDQLLSGGFMLGAIFMATDYATSPVTPKGRILFGVGCGALTVLFRSVGLYPEGVTYAILIMNGCAWAMDRCTAPRRFGTKKGEWA